MYLLSDSSQNHIFQHKETQKSTKPRYLSKFEHYSTSSSSSDGYVEPETKLVPRIKKDGSFKDLVTQSTIFADKSLFIKTVIEDTSTGLLIAMPRRWGKTVNLDMLKRFLEIPVDNNGEPISGESTDNYKLFAGGQIDGGMRGKVALSPLKISDAKLFNETKALDLQGTYPVIYIDFKNCKADDYNSIKKLVRAELSESFKQHAYLQYSPKLSIRQRKLVEQYIEESEDAQIETGLKVLSNALHDHYGKKVWILIDEYDAVLNAAYQDPYFSDSDLKYTISLFRGSYEKALKGNKFLEKSVITGIQFIAKASAGSGLNNLENIDVTTPQYAPYYGLSQEEFERFCEHFKVPKKYFEDAKQWYDGYTVRIYDQDKNQVTDEIDNKYNIWSIISYLKDADFKNFKSYWEESGSIDFLQDLFKSTNIKEKIEQLVDDKNGKPGTIIFNRESNFSDKDFSTLKDMIGSNKVVGEDGINILFSYLFILGYLTIDGLNHDSYQIPNMEIKHEMGKRLIEYYQTICTVDPEKIQGLTSILQNVMNIKEPNQKYIKGLFKNFYDQFKEIIQGIRLVDDKNDAGVFTNEDIVHSILNYIVLQTQHSTFGSEIYTSKLHSDKKGRADIKITNEDVGIIIEVKCVPVPASDNGHMREAIEQAISYRNLLKNINNKIFVAINVEKKVVKPEERAIELLCASDMFNEKDVFGIDILGEDNTFGVSSDFMGIL
jgi:hypothetical protein